MSRFTEKLQRVYRGVVSSMGFRRAGEEEIPQMIIIASLSNTSIKTAKVAAGADAVIIDGKALAAEDIKKLTEVLGEVPLGVVIDSSNSTNVNEIVEAGFDFVIFDIETPLESANKEGPGKILRIEPTMDLGMVRAIGAFPLSIDGVLIGGEDFSLTVERLLICQRFSDLLDKPLLLTVGTSISSDELSNLCQAGVKGIVISSLITVKAIAELKKAISCMPKPTKRKTKANPILPRLSSEPESMEGEEEEEEDI